MFSLIVVQKREARLGSNPTVPYLFMEGDDDRRRIWRWRYGDTVNGGDPQEKKGREKGREKYLCRHSQSLAAAAACLVVADLITRRPPAAS